MSLKGNLDSFYFASILQYISSDKRTGELLVTGDKGEVQILARGGNIVSASTPKSEDKLGQVLLKRDAISEEDLAKCRGQAESQKKPLAKVLIEKGYITSGAFQKFFARQMDEILFDLFLWRKGEFEFVEKAVETDPDMLAEQNTVELILEASRRIDEISVLKRQIESDELVFKISEKFPQQKQIVLEANEWHVLSLVNGKRAVKDIIADSGYDEFPVYKLLFSLVSSGLLERLPVVSFDGPAPPEPEKEQEVPREPNQEEARASDQSDTQEIPALPPSYSGVIAVHNDVLQVVYKHLVAEIGNRAPEIFEESKGRLKSRERILFKNYHPDNPTFANIRMMMEAAASIKTVQMEKGAFVVAACNSYLKHVLNSMLNVVGPQRTSAVADEISRVVTYVEKYHPSSEGKDAIIAGIRKVTARVLHRKAAGQGKQKDSKKSLFSALKKPW